MTEGFDERQHFIDTVSEKHMLRRPSQWKPIETAPKGKCILLGWAGDFMPEIARFHEERGWLNEYSDPVHAPPTHWMPLPEPPPD